MRIHVLSELRQPIGATSSFDLEDFSLNAQGVDVVGLSGSASTVRTDRGLLLTVKADGTVKEQCSRCLQPALSPVHVEFTEEYVPIVDPETGAGLHYLERGDEFSISRDFFLDVTEGLRQYILMSEPSKPLCTPECKGLCPDCGLDMNQGSCRCAEANDARWQPLAALTRISEGR